MSKNTPMRTHSAVADATAEYRHQQQLLIPGFEAFCPGSDGFGEGSLADLLRGELSDQDKEAVLIAARRILDCKSQDSRFCMEHPSETSHYLRTWLSTIPNEVFVMVYLDTHRRVIARETLFQGTIDGATVHPRLVVQRALHHNAAAAICAHNHPSGSVDPSSADRAITRCLKDALALVDVRLLDHFVVGTEGAVSLAGMGWV